MSNTNTSADTRQPANDLKTLIEYEGRLIVPLSQEHYQIVLGAVDTLEKHVANLADDGFYEEGPTEERRQQLIENLRTVVREEFEKFFKSHKGKRPRPQIPDIFASGGAHTSSAQAIQAIVNAQNNAASGGAKWQYPEGHPPYYQHKGRNTNVLVEYSNIKPDEIIVDDTAMNEFRAQIREMNDLDSDLMLAVFAHLLKGPHEPDGSVWIMFDKLLDYRGIQPIMRRDTPDGKKRRAGHRQEDILEYAQRISKLECIWLTIDQFLYELPTGKKKRGKRVQNTIRSRLLSIDETWYQRELDTGDLKPDSPVGYRVRAGTWLKTFITSPNRHVAWLCQKTLQYDPLREQWEKRLSKYFMFQIRMNARGGGRFNRGIGTMLSELSLDVDRRNPERTKQRFEKAMNRLVSDGQISEWNYTENVDYKAKKWIETWLVNNITIYIAPPLEQIDAQQSEQ